MLGCWTLQLPSLATPPFGKPPNRVGRLGKASDLTLNVGIIITQYRTSRKPHFRVQGSVLEAGHSNERRHFATNFIMRI